jgi:hypothetical protein
MIDDQCADEFQCNAMTVTSANGAAGIEPRAQRSQALGKGAEKAKP